MRKLLCLGLLLLSFAGHAQTCGPPDYASPCALSDTDIHPYPLPIPSWGPNTACMNAATTLAAIGQCGNLTGAGTVITTNDDFHAIMTRITDVNVDTVPGVSNPVTTWQTADEPSVNLWNTDDTAFMGQVNGGGQYVFSWDGTTATILNPRVLFPTGTVFSRAVNNQVYSIDKTTAGGPYLKSNSINFSTSVVTATTLFQFSGSNCLTNSVNGYTGGAFPLNQWNGALTSPDGVNFGIAFSLLPAQGGGYYQTAWTVGQVGCDLLNTKTGVVTHNGVLVGTIPDTQWTGPVPPCPIGGCGGKADRFTIHDSNMPNATTVAVAATSAGGLVYGTYAVGDYFWQVGTLNFNHCGIGAPQWKSGASYVDGNRVLPLPINSTVNPGGYIFQIVNGTNGNAGSDITIFKTSAAQTPGSNTTDGGVTWRNTGLNGALVYPCDGHTWKGYVGIAAGKNYTYHTYANPATPLLQLGPKDGAGNPIVSAGDQHFGNTYANPNDTWKIWVSSTDYGTTTDLLHGPIPSALYMENFLVGAAFRLVGNYNCRYDAITCPTGTLGQVKRTNHCYGTGWHKSFDVQNCIAVISQTGKYALQATDLMGQLGNTSGAAKCNPGGPKWNATDNVDYPVGTVIYPILSNDSGAYLYKVQSCSGTGPNPCQTGTTQPDWSTHQQSCVSGTGCVNTFVDGTITWQGAPDINNPANTAKQNCRADLVIVQLFRGAGPTPATTAPTLTMFVKLKNEMRRLYEKNFHHAVISAADGFVSSRSAVLGSN